jgi:hypothetical protein
MSSGALQIDLTDLSGSPVQGDLHMTFSPAANSGGRRMEVDFPASGATDFTISNLPCRPGAGTLYQITIEARHYRTYSFFQTIDSGVTAVAADNPVGLAINPSGVRDILAPPTAPELQDILPSSTFFDSQDSLRKACLLNIFAKARHPSAANAFRFVQSLLRLEQDRVFCSVAPELEPFLIASDRFRTAPKALHTPLPGFVLRGSFKSRDPRANIQFTLMRERTTGSLAADIDIDEATGIEHGLEVLRNQLTGGKTNPYQVHQLLLLSELDPGYQLLLR